MFGSSTTPFGTGAGFGTGTTFGGQKTGTQFGGTGLSTNLFGNKPTGFGSAFGSQPQSSGTTGLFGSSTATSTGGSLFGGTTTGSLFGQQPTTQTSFGGFGSGGTGLFGTQAKSTSGASVFPTPGQTSTFGSGTSTGFGATGSSLFGNTANKGTSLFGASQQTGTSLFGQSGIQGSSTATLGTPVKFNVVTGTDSMVKNGITTNISIRHQCITVMDNYANKCLEELRVEDYEAGRKTGASATTGFSGLSTSTGSGGLFGNTSTAFGATSAFGQKPTTGFGTAGSLFGGSGTTSLFGQQQQQQTAGSLFGQKTGGLFSTPTSSTTSTGFGTGFGTGGTTGLFGQSSTGQTTSLFGAPTTTASTGLFGAQSGFGQTQTGTGLFGQTGFGQTQQQSTLFGGKQFGSTLGAGTTGGLFGAQNKPQTGFNFGASTTGLGTSAFGAPTGTAGSLFSAKPTVFGTGTAFGANTGTGVFGATGTLGAGTGLGTGTLGTGFGSLGTQQSGGFGLGTLGSNQNTTLSTIQQQQQQQLQQQQQQLLLQNQLQILANSPFGDSPLFRNSLAEKAKGERASSATSSSIQKNSTTPSHYKVSPRPSARIKPRPINNYTMNKSKLFEGLEEDSGLSPDTFVPRKNIKKLVIKSKSTTEDSPMSIVDTTRVKFHSLVEGDDLPVTSSPFPPSPPSSQNTSPVRKTLAVEDVAAKAADDRINTSDGASPMGVRFSKGATRETLDTTIADLNVRHVTRQDDDQESVKSSEVTEEDLAESGTKELCGITLKRSEYYTVPPLVELNKKIDSNGDVFVDDFVVGREGYGKVKFYGRTNVAGLNLDEIVFFRRREIEVYPDSYPNKPPVGEKLNKKAEITLEKVWPNDKTSHKPITSPERLKLQGWQERVEAATAKLGATFLDYDPDNGNWVFTVEHFTRYGMHEYLDDEQLAKKLKRPPLKPHLQDTDDSLEKEKHEIFKRLQEKKQQLEAYEKERQRASLSLHDQDSDMPDIDNETFPEEMLDDEAREGSDASDEELESSPSSHQLATALGMNAQRIQVMKASFFTDQSQPSSGRLSSDRPSVDKSLLSASFSKPGHTKSSVYPAVMPLGPLLSPKVQRRVDESVGPEQMPQSLFGSPKIGVYPLRHPVVHDLTPAAPPSPMLLPTAIGTAMDIGIKVVGARSQFGLVPKDDSLVNTRENLVGDAGLMMGRSFRVGWGPGFVLVHSGTPLGKREKQSTNPITQPSLVGDFLAPKPRPSNSDGTPAFGVTLEKLNVAAHFSRGSDTVLAQHQSVLEAGLHHAEVSVDNGCPFIQPSTDVKALHHHAEIARKNKDAAVSGPLKEAAEQVCLVWDLVVALWGKLDDEQEDDEGKKDQTRKVISTLRTHLNAILITYHYPDLSSASDWMKQISHVAILLKTVMNGIRDERESYQNRMARKEALSRWLAEAAKTRISKEIDEANFQESDHLKSIFSYLTGKQISRACNTAQQHGDYRLSLLLSQVTGNSATRNLIYKQLSDWQEIKADMFIDEERIKIYALLAGAMVWPLTRDTVNVCEGLDWKRVLAVHLWYCCSPTSSIQDALNVYEASFKGSSSYGKYGAPPRPPFMEENDEDEDEENNFMTRDTCYHLLKLYCKRSHRLERLLSPSTSTAHQLDFRLSWHLYQVLQSLEYTHLSQYHAGVLHSGFAAQLEGLGLWHWAAFVLLHIQDLDKRENAVRSLLCRHCCLSADYQNVEKERFMLDDLKIPAEWIHEAKALRSRYEGRTREEAFHLVKARHWSLGHNIVLRGLVSDAIINGEYDILKALLGEMEPRDRSSTVREWATGGQVFLDYLALMEKFQDIAKGKVVPTKYDLEDIHAEVSSLCTRINSLPSNTSRDLLCQYDMAKMCANFMKIVMKELTDLTDEGEALLPTHILAPHVTRLPMPEDCSLAELRQLVPSYITEITAGH